MPKDSPPDESSAAPDLSLGRVYVYLFFILTGGALLSASTQNLGYLMEAEDVPFWYPLIWELTGFYAVLLFVPIIWAAQRRWPMTRESWVRHGLVHLGVAAAISVLTTTTFYLLRVAIYRVLGLGPYEYGILSYRYLYEFNKFVVVYAFFIGLFWLHRYVAIRRTREAAAARLAQDLAEARLASLTAQVNPHFLFNALNTISSVMYDDVRRADAMISQLSDLLRASLAHSEKQLVSVDEECRILGLYIELMTARFGARLQVTVESPPEVAQRLIPAFLLQPLVENAIKHHPMQHGQTVVVGVSIASEGSRLKVTVADNGPGLKNGDEIAGLGLRNLRARLEHLYGDAHDFALENREAGGLRVVIRLPERAAGARTDQEGQ